VAEQARDVDRVDAHVFKPANPAEVNVIGSVNVRFAPAIALPPVAKSTRHALPPTIRSAKNTVTSPNCVMPAECETGTISVPDVVFASLTEALTFETSTEHWLSCNTPPKV
jgi:hypothetical protein